MRGGSYRGLLLVLFLLFNTPAEAEVGELTDAELQALIAAGVPVMDIRRDLEWEETGVIPGSHLLTFFDERGKYDLDAWLADVDELAGKDKPFVLVCRNGNRTEKIGRYLEGRLGYKQVYHLTRGIYHWIEAGLPIDTVDP